MTLRRTPPPPAPRGSSPRPAGMSSSSTTTRSTTGTSSPMPVSSGSGSSPCPGRTGSSSANTSPRGDAHPRRGHLPLAPSGARGRDLAPDRRPGRDWAGGLPRPLPLAGADDRPAGVGVGCPDAFAQDVRAFAAGAGITLVEVPAAHPTDYSELAYRAYRAAGGRDDVVILDCFTSLDSRFCKRTGIPPPPSPVRDGGRPPLRSTVPRRGPRGGKAPPPPPHVRPSPGLGPARPVEGGSGRGDNGPRRRAVLAGRSLCPVRRGGGARPAGKGMGARSATPPPRSGVPRPRGALIRGEDGPRTGAIAHGDERDPVGPFEEGRRDDLARRSLGEDLPEEKRATRSA